MEKNSSVICMGELLIDFFCTDVGIDLVEGRNFEKQAGGAPANVAATIAKLGGEAIFSGKVGADKFGYFLKNVLEEVKVDASMLLLDEEIPTTLAFVSLMENGERDFIFNRGADANLTEEDLDKKKLEQAKILHFGSATALLDDPFKKTYLNSLRKANENGQFVSFDPNYRSNLWAGMVTDFVDLVRLAITYTDFLKVSDEELMIISGEKDLLKGVESLHLCGASTVAVTLGEKGTFISNGKKQKLIPGIKVKAIDTTGAGDAFVGAMLYQLAKESEPKRILTEFERLEEMTLFCNKVAGIVCTKIGAISALPTYEEVLA